MGMMVQCYPVNRKLTYSVCFVLFCFLSSLFSKGKDFSLRKSRTNNLMMKLKFNLDEKIKGPLAALAAFWFHAQKMRRLFFRDFRLAIENI